MNGYSMSEEEYEEPIDPFWVLQFEPPNDLHVRSAIPLITAAMSQLVVDEYTLENMGMTESAGIVRMYCGLCLLAERAVMFLAAHKQQSIPESISFLTSLCTPTPERECIVPEGMAASHAIHFIMNAVDEDSFRDHEALCVSTMLWSPMMLVGMAKLAYSGIIVFAVASHQTSAQIVERIALSVAE